MIRLHSGAEYGLYSTNRHCAHEGIGGILTLIIICRLSNGDFDASRNTSFRCRLSGYSVVMDFQSTQVLVQCRLASRIHHVLFVGIHPTHATAIFRDDTTQDLRICRTSHHCSGRCSILFDIDIHPYAQEEMRVRDSRGLAGRLCVLVGDCKSDFHGCHDTFVTRCLGLLEGQKSVSRVWHVPFARRHAGVATAARSETCCTDYFF